MKKLMVFALAFSGIVYAQAQSNGQGNGQSKSKKGTPQATTKSKVGNGNGQGQTHSQDQGHGHGQPNANKPKQDSLARAQKMTKIMDSVVTLTPEQKTKISDIQKRRLEEMQAIKAKYNGDMKLAGPEIKTARQKYKTEMDAVLSPEQKQKWEAYKEKKKQEMSKKKEEMQKGKPSNSTAPKPSDDDDEDLED